MKKMRYLLSAGMASAVMLCAANAHADTLLHLPQTGPMITGIRVNNLVYTYSSGIGTMQLSSFVSSTGIPSAGTLSSNGVAYGTSVQMTAKFNINTSTGAITSMGSGSFLNVLQDLDNNGSFETTQFTSSKLLKFGYGLRSSNTPGQYEFLWDKGSGTSLKSNMPFIGELVRMGTALSIPDPSGDFRSNFTIVAGSTSKADFFFTPLPKSGIAGAFLISVLGAATGWRRRSLSV